MVDIKTIKEEQLTAALTQPIEVFLEHKKICQEFLDAVKEEMDDRILKDGLHCGY
jgi:hypothetical protein